MFRRRWSVVVFYTQKKKSDKRRQDNMCTRACRDRYNLLLDGGGEETYVSAFVFEFGSSFGFGDQHGQQEKISMEFEESASASFVAFSQ